MPDWLELELAHRLGPAKAPDDLWDRICNGRAPQPARRPIWPVAAIVTLTVALGAMWMVAKGEQSSPDLEHLARLQLQVAQPLDIESGEAGDINTWAQRATGIDPKVAPSERVELLGARLIRHGKERIAAISYRVDGQPAALLVAHASIRGNTPHQGLAIAGLDTACLICHSSL